METLYINSFLFHFPEPEYSAPEKFLDAKSEYNHRILTFFRKRNFLAEQNFVNDVEVYVPMPNVTFSNHTFAVYDRFCLKISYNENHCSPELIVSYERSMLVLKSSMYEISQTDIAETIMPKVNKVLEAKCINNDPNQKFFRIHKLSRLKEKARHNHPEGLNYNNLYPIINQQLRTFFQIPNNQDTDFGKNKYNYVAKKTIEFTRL